MAFRTWVHEQAPLNSQWPVLKNGGVDTVVSISIIVGLLILCNKNVLGL